MSITGGQLPIDTEMTPAIAADRLKQRAHLPGVPYAEGIEEEPVEGYLVRMPITQVMVTFRLNTKRLVERREIQRANQALRQVGS